MPSAEPLVPAMLPATVRTSPVDTMMRLMMFVLRSACRGKQIILRSLRVKCFEPASTHNKSNGPRCIQRDARWLIERSGRAKTVGESSDLSRDGGYNGRRDHNTTNQVIIRVNLHWKERKSRALNVDE